MHVCVSVCVCVHACISVYAMHFENMCLQLICKHLGPVQVMCPKYPLLLLLSIIVTCCAQSEAIPENLKNMLLVMETAGIFQTDAGTESKLWRLTWDKIDTFLPTLRDDIFKPFEPGTVGLFRSGLPFQPKSLKVRL